MTERRRRGARLPPASPKAASASEAHDQRHAAGSVRGAASPDRRGADGRARRLFEARYPRLGPPQKPFIHIPGLPKPEPRPALTIKEAMGTVPIARSGRIAIMARSTNKGMSRTTAPPRPAQ
jgi:hypothetical protein